METMQEAVQGFRLSPLQERPWRLSRDERGMPAYALGVAAVEGEIVAARLEEALRRVVQRHEALRTTIRLLPGTSIPVQVIADAASLPLRRTDLSGLPAELQERDLERLGGEICGPAGGDAPAEPALRAVLAVLEPRRAALLLALPALFADAATFDCLVREIACCHAAVPAGEAPLALGEPVQYADVAAWQLEQRSGVENAAGAAYWRRLGLGGELAVRLPFERGALTPFTPRTLRRTLGGERLERLEALARGAGVEPSDVLLTTWRVLIDRLVDRPQVVIGVAFPGRDHEDLAEALGLLASSVPVTGEVVETLGFDAALATMARAARIARQWQDAFDWSLVSGQGGGEDSGFSFCFESGTQPERRDGGPASFRLERWQTWIDRFRLRLSCVRRDGAIEAAFDYDAAVLDAVAVERLSGWYLHLLDQALAAPSRPLGSLELLAGDDRERLAALNDTALDLGGPATLHGLFHAQAERSWERTAVVLGEQEMTYGELRRRSAALARHLRAAGVDTDTRVGLCVPRSFDMVVGMLGVLEAGGAYVPLDPAYPAERLAFMVDDARAEVVLTQRGLAAGLPAGCRRVCLDEPGTFPEGFPAGFPAGMDGAPAGLPDSLAYVIYTSGSTGRPKGVMISHRAILNRLLWMQHAFPLGPDDRVLQKTSYSFDASVWEIFSPLLAGACLVLAEPDGHRDPAYLVAAAAAHGVTHLQFVPSQLETVLDEPGLAAAGRSLRRVFCGGEALSAELCARFFARLDAALCNLYGPTEVAIDATFHPCLPDVLAAGAKGAPIGRPLANVRSHVLDRAQRRLAPGLPGELYVAGAGLARGYFGRPALTAERFLPDPWSPAPGGRLYRSGDLARLRPNGELEYLGRVDGQVKVRGFRIELGEIEAVLASHPAVREGVVAVRGQQLAGYAVPGGAGEPPTASELRAFLAARLPEFMVPSALMILKTLPRLPNGKLDRGALPRPAAGGGGETRRAGLGNDFEALLAALWTEVLEVPEVGETDDFFALGGHSLMGIRLNSRVREVFGVDLGVRTLFREPTFNALAAAISHAMMAGLREQGEEEPVRPETLSATALHHLAQRLAARQAGAAPIQALPSAAGPWPLSFAQERLWFLEQLEPGTPFYNIPGAVRLRGGLRPEVLTPALAELVARHGALRTTFGDQDGRPYQVIAPAVAVGLPLIDLAALPPAAREGEVELLVTAETRRPFDLARGPLLRVVLYRLDGRDHVLVHTLHHIVSDGWSSEIFVREITALYRAFCAGRPSPLPPLPLQYADYAVAQREQLAGERLAAQLAYWRRQLAGTTGLELPGDRPRPAVETFRGMSRPVRLDGATTRALHALAQRHGATLFMTLLAAFQTLLWRYSGQTDVPVGSPIANRNRRQLEGVFGFFANTLVLRTDLSGSPTFAALLRRVSEVTLGAYAHEDLPFERLVEELQPERDMSRNPLFQIMFVLQNQPREEIALEDLAVSPLAVDSATAKFDLTMFWREEQGALAGVVEHNSDLFDRATVLRFYRHFEGLVAAVLADPGRPVGELPLLSPVERHQMLAEWNDVAAAASREICAHAWVEEQVAQSPEALAAVFAGRRLSYRELNATANRWAHGLRRRGVGPESLVGICVERSLDMVVAALAVLKAGGAIVALDPAYPRERLATIIQDSGLSVLLTGEALLRHFPGHRDIALCLDGGEDPFAGESAENPRSGVTPDSPMYVIYTSGSTGAPKGIVVPHRQFANLLQWQLAGSPLAAPTRTAQYATFGFCVSFQEIFTSWCREGTLVVVDEMTRRDIEGLGRFVAAEGIERLHLPYAALKHLAEALAGRPELPARLREVITAGEQLRVTPAVRALFERLPGCKLHNQYGASETHVVSSLTLAGEPADWPAIPAVGRTIARVRIHLLDERLEPVPAGVLGELYAGGFAVPRGYLNDSVLTAQKMVPDPHSGGAGERLYRTGDLARYLATGAIEYLGRRDGQVKVRGFRVELGEVETVLARHPGLRDVAVVAQPAPGEGQRLVAYLVPEGEPAPPFEELRAYLRQLLPEYMVPADFMLLPVLPLNANGKLDQAALPAVAAAERGAGYVAPRDAAEEQLAAIWADVLGLERVGIAGNFFELGGHSLLATQVVSRVRAAFGVDLALRTLFEAPTVAALAARVATLRRGAPPAPLLPRLQGARDHWPLSFAQNRLWFLDRLQPGSTTYNLALGLRLEGDLDVAALAAALGEIVRRHETLRTVFTAVQGDPVQVVRPAGGAFPLPVVDLSGLDAAAMSEMEMEVERIAAAEAGRPFDLERGPLFRPLLMSLPAAPGGAGYALFAGLHHVIADGWSLGVLVRELGTLYAAYRAGERPPLPPLPELALQYRDFAVWQRQSLAGPALAAEVDFWRPLASLPALLELPTDRQRPARRSGRGALLPFRVGRRLAAGLSELAREEGATLFMGLLAGMASLLSRLSGRELLSVGTPIANRGRVELEGLIGFFANLLVLRGDLSGEPSVRDLVARVRQECLAAYAHQEVPFEKLVEELAPERSLAYTPLFQVAFALQNAPMPALELPGLRLTPWEVATDSAKFDLTLTLTEVEGELAGELEYATDLFDAVTVERWGGSLLRLLAAMVERPEAPVLAVSLLSRRERQQLLVEWSGPAEPSVETGEILGLHERFAAQAERTPEAPALHWQGERLSYGELNGWAERLACGLEALGVEPGSRVALRLERSAGMVAAILGVLKAGCAYVPIDPQQPRERVAFVLGDTGAPVLVVDGDGGEEEPVAGWDGRVVTLAELASAGGTDAPRQAGMPADWTDWPAYVIYTSGSTGQPKGVVVSHGNVARLFATTQGRFGFGPADVWTLFHSYAFDFSVWELWGALLHGGRLVVVPYEVSRWPERFHALLAAEGVTVLNQTASAFRQLLGVELEREAGDLPALRWVIFGGEALDPRTLGPWVARHGAEQPGLVNMYGITETAVHVTFRRLGEAEVLGGESLIGEPLGDWSVHVLDARGEPVPLGVAGEMWVGGGGVSQGYLGRPGLTAERFVPDPFVATGSGGGRLYRSGDLGRWRRTGELEYLGRIDHQVKVRGFRIELGEIEAALRSCRGVREGVVLAREEEGGDKRLVGYVVAESGEVLSVAELRRELASRLPEYMVPAAFVELASLPLTANGKLDRQALPAPGGARPELGEEYTAPRTAVERALAEVWSEVLDLDRVGVEDNFFTLGGDSILSLRVLALAGERGIALSLPDLFRHQTVAELAAVAASGAAAAGLARPVTSPFSLISPADRALLPAGVEDAYPLAALQSGMIYHSALAPHDPAYQNVDSWHARGRFAEEPFREALRRVVARHPVLRTSFDLTRYSEPLQLVHTHAEMPLQVEDIRHLSPEQQEVLIGEELARRKAHLLDLGVAPQLRFHVFLRSADTFQVTLTENHAVFDGWSLHSTLSEIFELYLALLKGEEPEPPPPLDLQYRDYVAREQQALLSPEAAAYWERVLSDSPPVELPAWPPEGRTEAGPSRMRSLHLWVADDVFAGLKALARQASVPFKEVLIAAHVKALSLLTGQLDVLTGITSNGRLEEPGGDQVRGLFLNTLPLRVRLDPTHSWLDLARQVLAVDEEMMLFRRYPFAALQRKWSDRSIFEASFNYVHFHAVRGLIEGGELEVLGFQRAEGGNFKFTANFVQNLDATRLMLDFVVDSQAVGERALERYGRAYLGVLAAMTAAPGARHSTLSLLSGAERHQTLLEWNDGGPSPLSPLGGDLLPELFAAQAGRMPEATALTWQGGSLTFRDLDRRANQLARHLRAGGAAPEARVGILLGRSPDLVVSILATVKSGAAYVPLAPEYPRERLAFLAEDSALDLLVTERRLLDRLPPQEIPVVFLDEDAEAVASRPAHPLASGLAPDHLAYLIYTSGSTGRPKGVMVTHGGLANYLLWAVASYGGPEGGAPLHTSIGFDLTVTSLWWPLLAGRGVDLLPESEGVEGLVGALEAGARWSLLKITPAHLDALGHLVRPADLAGRVSTLVIGGEALHAESLDVWRRHSPGTRLINEYGPTETVVGCCVFEVDANTPGKGAVPIGRPIAATRLHLLDANLDPVPFGVPGELFIGGAGVARGYWRSPALTAARFVPDPFAGEPGARLYRSGDLARHLLDGRLEYLERIDDQVKIRGFRLEPGEVEAALAAYPAVQDAVVLVREVTPGDRRLVAYLVPAAGGTVDPVELREGLLARLPEFAVPSFFVELKGLPLTAHGKVDRAKLAQEPLPEMRARSGGAPQPAAALGRVESVLVEICRQLLRREEIGVHDNFFELGGDSILAILLTSRARKEGVHFAPGTVFKHPTIAGLAAVAKAQREAPADAGPATGEVPLTPIQHWFFAQGLTRPEHYNQALLVEVRLDDVLADGTYAAATAASRAALLLAAFGHLLEHHDALRLRFAPAALSDAGAAGWRQWYGEPGSAVPFTWMDLAALTPAARDVALEAAAAALQTGLDLARGPVLRTALFTAEGGAPDRLLLIAHHLVVDGVSWRILLEDLETCCRQLARGEAVRLPQRTSPFRLWAEHLRERGRSAELAAQAGYWLETLRRPFAPLPVDGPETGDTGTEGTARHVSTALDAEATRTLVRELPRVAQVQVIEALVAAVAAALAEWTGSRGSRACRALRLDLEGHGREEGAGLDLSRTVGWFTALFPVAFELPPERADVLAAVCRELRAVPEHGLGFGILRSSGLRTGDELLALPASQVVLNYLGQLDGAVGPERLFRPAAQSAGAVRDARQRRPYLLEISAFVSGGRMWIDWTYSESRHRRATVERLAESCVAALRALIARSAAPLPGLPATAGRALKAADFPLARLGQAALDRLLAEVAGEVEDLYPAAPTQQGLFFHSLRAPDSGVYVEQLNLELTGPLDVALLETAWKAVTSRHPALRTGFVWRNLERPLQVLYREAALPWEHRDWRELPADEQRARLAGYLREDRRRGFDLSRAPLMRLALLRLGDDRHLLVWTHHHAILDGWSVPILLGDVSRFYLAAVQGGEEGAAAVEPARPYRDYIAWLEAQNPAPGERFWRRTLAGFTQPTPLGLRGAAAPAGDTADAGDAADAEGERPAASHGAHNVSLSRAETDELRRFASRHQLTLGTVAQAAWAILLARYSGERDVLFGLVFSGRSAPLPGIDRIVGLFINTLPMRTEVPPGAPLASWVRGLQERRAEAERFEHASLAEVQSWSDAPAGRALFDSILVFENYPVDEAVQSFAHGALDVRWADSREQTNYPLTLSVAPGPQLLLRVTWELRLGDAPAMMRLLDHLRALLAGMVEQPDAPLASLPLLSPAERHQLRVEWNGTEQPWPAGTRYAGLFAQQERRAPEALAVASERGSLTYGELGALSERLALGLTARGVGAESLVALVLDRDLELLAAILAVFKAGAAYLPFDPERFGRRDVQTLVQSGVPVVLTHGRLAAEIARDLAAASPASPPEVLPEVLDLERLAAEVPAGRRSPGDIQASELAYVIYTSGSTGVPKGAMVEQAGMLNHLWAKVSELGLDAGSRILQSASPSFDISVWQLLAAGLVGGSVYIADAAAARSPERLFELLEGERITVAEVVPALLRGLLDTAADRRPGLESLRWLLVTGEALPAELCRRWLELYPRVPLLNAYGPTECSDDVTHHALWQAPAAGDAGVPIGRPLANLQIHLVDPDLRPMPLGVAGEIAVGGVGVGRGYRGDPARTAAVFVPDPLGPAPGSRLYRTGDLGSLRGDGTIEFLGRLDDQLKVRGFRIEPGEIEAALRDCEAVRQAVVVARLTAAGDQQLVAFVIPAGGTLDVEAVRRDLAQRLPDYMWPADYFPLESLPLTANGKVDRRGLAASAVAESPGSAFAAPRTRIEETLAVIWEQVLGVDRTGGRVGRQDNFFTLGGHSLLAIQLLSRLRDTFGVKVTLRSLFDTPTIESLATRLLALMREKGAVLVPPITRVSRDARDEALPLSFAQQRLWFVQQLDPESSAYNVPIAVKLEGRLKPAILERCFAEMVSRHETLRTTFVAVAGEAVQVIAPAGEAPPFFLPQVDLTRLGGRAEVEAGRLARAEARRAFDLRRGPLLRALLLRLGPATHVLVATIHHIVSDGWSLELLVRELVTLFSAHASGRAPSLPELPVQYADYAAWQRAWLRDEALASHLAFWREQLAGVPEVLDLPSDRPRPPAPTGRGGRQARLLGTSLERDLRDLGSREGCTLFMTALAAFQAFLACRIGGGDVLVGSPTAGRNYSEIEGLIGCFVNLLPLRADLSGDPGMVDHLRRVRRSVLDAQLHQDVPFDLLVETLRPRRDLGYNPIVQVAFTLQEHQEGVLSVPGLTLTSVPLEAEGVTVQFDLTLNMGCGPQGLVASMDYSSDLFDAATIDVWLADFELLLRAWCERPEAGLPEMRQALAAAAVQRQEAQEQELRAARRQKFERLGQRR
ncbi:MAG: non-ribosomal peptide synthase/polyketide synthase [Acidobacteria bacterium]|nr:non-ribosomal peptide synthase/polyketide synthase [Acidobacteriota bacterium]